MMRPRGSERAAGEGARGAATIEVKDLRIELASGGDDIVSEVSFDVQAGEIVGLVGESGSGKTTIGTALLAHVRRGAKIASGEVHVAGADMLARSEAELDATRGDRIAYVPQDPAAALNPARRLGAQLEELLILHEPELTAADRAQRMRTVLAEVKLPADGDLLKRYPHEVSGGQQQRMVIAMAFITRPEAIVLDEPTTGLDVTTQAHVLQTLRELCHAHGVATVYVTHDLALVKSLADRVIVLYAGRVVEQAAAAALFAAPSHPYTRSLLAAIPDVAQRRHLVAIGGQAPAPGTRPPGCAFAPRCEHAREKCTREEPSLVEVGDAHVVRCLRAHELGEAAPLAVVREREQRGDEAGLLTVRSLDAHYGSRQVLHDIDLTLQPRRCLALVGESGSGKTTLSRCLIGLHHAWQGEVTFDGEPLAPSARARSTELRRRIQYVFQNPYKSLNPRRPVGESVAVPLRQLFGLGRAETDQRVEAAFERVSLPARLATRRPGELSGGERQRVAIARALVCEPDVLICDEVTSALDVLVQAAIIELLEQLQAEQGLTMLFVTHNLAIVRAIAHEVIVLHDGRIVERGEVDRVLDTPTEEYTRGLLANSPSLSLPGAAVGRAGDTTSMRRMG